MEWGGCWEVEEYQEVGDNRDEEAKQDNRISSSLQCQVAKKSEKYSSQHFSNRFLKPLLQSATPQRRGKWRAKYLLRSTRRMHSSIFENVEEVEVEKAENAAAEEAQ